MRKFVTLSMMMAFPVGATLAYAAEMPDPQILESLKRVPLVDVMECREGDSGSLSSLKAVSQLGGKKKNKKTARAEQGFEERLVYWNAILGVASEDELIAAKAGVEQRRAERKKKRESMSVMDAAVYMARQDYPCDDIFEKASR